MIQDPTNPQGGTAARPMGAPVRWRGCLLLLLFLAVTPIAWADEPGWPMFRGRPANPGITDVQPADDLVLRWTFDTGEPIRSSPVVVGDRVWIGSDSGTVHALARADGGAVWRFDTEGPVEAPPTVVEGMLAVGSGDGLLYVLDAGTGDLRWKYRTDDRIAGAANWFHHPDTARLCFVVGSYDGRVHCVDAETGQRVWIYETENYVNGSVAVESGVVVFGGCDGLLHVVRAGDGTAVHRIPLGSYVAATAALREGRAYVGHYDNAFVCADVRAGRVLWTYEDRPFAYFSSAAVGEELVVVGGRDRRVHALRRDTGERQWVFATRGRVDSSPVICGERVVVGSDDGRLYMVDRRGGEMVWSYDVGEALVASPAVVEGWVVIGADDGKVYAFGARP